MKILNKFNKSYTLQGLEKTNRHFTTTIFACAPLEKILPNCEGQMCFQNKPEVLTVYSAGEPGSCIPRIDRFVTRLQDGWSDEFYSDLQALYTASWELDRTYHRLQCQVMPSRLVGFQQLPVSMNKIFAKIPNFKEIDDRSVIEAYRSKIPTLQEEIQFHCHTIYDNMSCLFPNLEQLTWCNCHMLHYYHYELSRLGTDVNFYLSYSQLSTGVARMLEISETRSFDLLLRQCLMSGDGDTTLQWAYSFKPLTKMLSESLVLVCEPNPTLYMLGCLIFQLASVTKQVCIKRHITLTEDLDEFLEESIRVASPKLAEISGMTEIRNKSVSEFLALAGNNSD